MEELDSFLATVDEFVDDENRIVTYKWLSQQLAISANKAKNILKTYAESCKKSDSNNINIVYVIIGRESAGMCVKVVKDVDLDFAKMKFDTVISVSMYSVQKAKLIDSSVLYAADYNNDRDKLTESGKLGSITYEGATKLSKTEIKQKSPITDKKSISTELEKQFAKPNKGKNTQQKMNFFSKSKTSPKKETITPAPKEETVEKPTNKPKSGVAAFMSKEKNDPFAKSKPKTKQTIKKEEKISEKEEISEQDKKKDSKIEPKVSKANGDLKNLEKDKDKKSEKISDSAKRSFEDDGLKIDDFPDDIDFVPKKAKTKKISPKRISPKNNQKAKKKTRNDSNDLPAKKRRRIQEMSSSSSEEEEDPQEEMETLPPSPPPPSVDVENIPANIQTETTKNKLMKKVLKTKTFIDEEGFMVTEKCFELEESIEVEPVANGNSEKLKNDNNVESIEELVEKKKLSSTSTAKQPKKQQKQASITGFFKKK